MDGAGDEATAPVRVHDPRLRRPDGSLTLGRARVTMDGVADAFAQDQQISGERARQRLGWAPTRPWPLEELVEGL